MSAAEGDFVYMPFLKWRQGEQFTLRTMDDTDRSHILPVVELVSSGSTPQDIKQALIEASNSLVKVRADQFPFAVDVKWMSPVDARLVKLLSRAMAYMDARELWALPVITPGMIAAAPDDLKTVIGKRHVVLRISARSFLDTQIGELISSAAALIDRKAALHVVLDMEEIAGALPEPLAERCAKYCVAAQRSPRATTVTLAGGSFPFNLTGIKKGRSLIPRVEWRVWERVRGRPGLRRIKFGDYAVTNPGPTPQIDGKAMNPSVAIRYAVRDDWLLLKGGLWKGSGKLDYHSLCSLLLDEQVWAGKEHSKGDASMDAHAHTPRSEQTGGSPGVWRRDATSHHVVATAKRCFVLSGPAASSTRKP